MTKFYLIFVTIFAISSSALAFDVPHLVNPMALIHQVAPKLAAKTYQQTIDHTGKTAGTFAQRYWIDDEYASSDSAPVIIRICGEATGEDFFDDISVQHAQTLKAHVIYLEHRFYGQSQPFSDLSADHLKHLTTANVIADIAQFITAMKKTMPGKWIVIGGSYSGTLAAMFRQQHPELVVGALAASAPMYEKDFPEGQEPWGDDNTSIDANVEGGRVWDYQGCTAFSFWEGYSMTFVGRPPADFCKDQFGVTAPVDFTVYNNNFYAPVVSAPKPGATSPSNILFTSGSDDIWSQLSINSSNNKNPNITTMLIEGAGHHFDTNSASSEDTPQVLQARSLFLSLAKKWLAQK